MNKLIFLTTFLAFFAFAGVTLAKNGPAEKATGEVGGAPRGWYADFNAHEALGDKLAKGQMRTWSDEVSRELLYDVKYVRVEGDMAWFAAEATYDSGGTNVGKWLFVKVYDGGEPGIGADWFGWDWSSGTNETDAMNRVNGLEDPDNWWGVTNGNLQVHSYYDYGYLVDTVFVPGDNASGADSNINLADNQEYIFKASGTYRFANWGAYGIADAEWAYRNDGYKDSPPADHGWTVGELTYPSLLGLDVLVDGNNVDWGDYSPEHQYDTSYVGDGTTVHFSIYDSAYGDNSGGINVDIIKKVN